MQVTQPIGDTYCQREIDSSYLTKFFVFVLVLFLIKIFLAFVLELGNDEAYYWLYSQYLQWNYFDHPPMVALWIRLFTLNLSLQQCEGFLRLGSVVGCVLSSWFLFRTVTLLHSERAAWFAAVMYNMSFYSGITAGLYIMPDSPEMVFWTLSLLMVVRLTSNEDNWTNWLLFGLAAGLAIMSKVHGAFLWLGVGGYALFRKRSWLTKPQFHIAWLLTLVVISPIFFWNVEYNFITFRFHSKRVDINRFIPHTRYFFKELASQVGFNNPVNYFVILSALIAFYRKRVSYQPALAIFNFAALPLAFLLLFVSLFRNVTLPHWSGPAYVSLMPLGAIWLAENSKAVFPSILKWGLVAFLLAYLAYGGLIEFYPGTFGSHDENDYGRGDITLDMYGWRKASQQFESLYRQDVKTNRMPGNAAMITTKWWGAHVEYYFARPLGLKTVGVGKPAHLNQYLWTNRWRKGETDLNNAYCVIPADDRYNLPADFFEKSELALTADVARGGQLAHRFFVYRLRGLNKEVPVVK